MDDSLRTDKVAFISGHEGTTYLDLSITAVGSIVLAALLNLKCNYRSDFVWTPRITKLVLVDFASLVVPLCWIILFPKSGILFCSGVILLAQIYLPQKSTWIRISSTAVPPLLTKSAVPSLCLYRATLTILTCFSILAVDFNVFPRHHAKTELFGISLMDLGTGSVILSSGIFAGRHRRVQSAARLMAPTMFRNVPVLVLLGSARNVVVLLANYNVPVGEYGTHWNFFITLSVVTLLAGVTSIMYTAVVHPITGSSEAAFYSGLAAAVAITHELMLTQCGLEEYVMMAPRDNLIAANKEGIVSTLGYFAIYLVGCSLGCHIFQSNGTAPIARVRSVLPRITLILAAVMLFSSSPSRKLVNVRYPTWAPTVPTKGRLNQIPSIATRSSLCDILDLHGGGDPYQCNFCVRHDVDLQKRGCVTARNASAWNCSGSEHQSVIRVSDCQRVDGGI
eukprot:m.326529 g.326529  ORF g.326529 m.326529 type:complete len:450 (-) comp20408_c0_seq1:209-1558(-)